jgi:carbonic anhydrase/acetyltransferase-like protein (isoleucine patch superfamily)
MAQTHAQNIQSFANQWPQLASGIYIHSTAIVIGDVHVGENSSVWPGAVIRGDMNAIRIGKNTNVQDLSMLHVACEPQIQLGFRRCTAYYWR